MILFVFAESSSIYHNITFYASNYESMSHNYISQVVATRKEAQEQYPYYLNATCDLDIGYPSSNYPVNMVLYCTGSQFNPSITPYIGLNIGRNEIRNFKLNSSLLYDQVGVERYNYFWFGQFILSVRYVYNATLGANATLDCMDVTICNKTDYCIDYIQNI